MDEFESPELFELPLDLPAGMRHADGFISAAEERDLVAAIAPLPYRAFEFRGYEGRRRVVSFGWAYDFGGGRLRPADAMPLFLQALRNRAAAFAGVGAETLAHALVTEYAPGAPIGWHRDRPEFGDVVGISLAAPCRFRLRRRRGDGWERRTLPLKPRSAYLLRGPSRTEWEHSIPPVEVLRYSITFRSLTRG